ncbi:hemerythrin domain-containing protein [Methanobacterium sp.]|uniref:hemerythrin domain-containing protein n=1 Tax=Methanobacterium sp. TaxID=2164 RepID=UPI003C739B4B
MAGLFDMLKQDHKEVTGMLEQAIESKDPSQFPKVKKMLEVHMEGEEKFFYPILRNKDKETMLEAYEEHEVGKRLLKEIEGTQRGNERCMPRIKVLKDVLDHHIKEEESEIFDEARDLLDNQQEQKIVQQIKELKSQKM